MTIPYRLSWIALSLAVLGVSGCDIDYDKTQSSPKVVDQQPIDAGAESKKPVDTGLYGTGYRARTLQDEIIYHVMLDRFTNGDSSNDDGEPGTLYSGNLDPTQLHYYHGGDLKGVQDRLDYLAGMGITALWLSPVYKGIASVDGLPNYHGYMISDFLSVDPHLGGDQALHDLVDAAHARGIKIFLDAVMSQTTNAITYDAACGDGCPFRELDEPAYTPLLIAGRETIKNPVWMNDPQYYHNRGMTYHAGDSRVYGDFSTLDGLDTTNPFVQDGMIEIHKYWVETFGIDGFRLDTVPYNPVDFWQKFSPELHQFATQQGIPNFAFFGEVAYEPAPVASRYTNQGGLDSTLDFGVYSAVADVFGRQGAPLQLAGAFNRDEYYNDADSSALNQINFASNHDFGRFGAFLRLANPNASETELLQRFQQALGFLFFARGVPLIYYGDEQGFVGDDVANTGHARQDMFPTQVAEHQDDDLIGTTATPADSNFDTAHPLYQTIQAYSTLYKQHKALRSGQQWLLYANEQGPGGLVMSRILVEDGVEYVIAFNSAATEQSVQVTTHSGQANFAPLYPANLTAIASDNSGQLALTLPPFSVSVYQAQSEVVLPEAAPTVELTLADNELADNVFTVPVNVSAPGLATVNFEYSTDGTSFTAFSQDWQAPYVAYLNTASLPDGQNVILRATVEDLRGQTATDTTQVIIDHRGLTQLTVHYENPNQQQQLILLDNTGDYHGPYALQDNQVTIALDDSIRQLLAVFETRNGDQFSYDTPVPLSIKSLLADAQSDGNGALQAEIYVNGAGQWSAVDNYSVDTDVAPLTSEDTLQGDAIYFRGSMNGWSSNDAFEYVGNGTYKQTLRLTKGHHEYNFQTATQGNWTAPVTATGLSNIGYNAEIHVDKSAYYDVYFTQLTDAANTYRFYQVYESSNVPPFFTQPVYLRGIDGDWGTGDNLEMIQQGGNVYTVDLAASTGLQIFKVATADWSSQYGLAELQLGEFSPVYPSCCTDDDLLITLDEAGVYRFTADMSDLEQPKVKVDLLPDAQ